MRFGLDQTRECPHCQQLFYHWTLVSGNSLGFKSFSDGKTVLPMLRELPRLMGCPHCKGFVWREKAVLQDYDPQTQRKASQYLDLSETAFLRAIQETVYTNPDEERYLREQAWWESNEAQRNAHSYFSLWRWLLSLILQRFGRKPIPLPPLEKRIPPQKPRTPEQIANMLSLNDLLDANNPEDRLLKAEIFRQLGRFEEAEQWLTFSFPAPLEPHVAVLRNGITERSTFLALLAADRY